MRKLATDIYGIAVLGVWGIIALISAIGITIGVTSWLTAPDVTYNISDTGLAFAGGQIDWIWIIIGGAIFLFIVLWAISRRKDRRRD